MHRIIFVQPQSDFTLQVSFEDGLTRRINLKPFIGEGISAPLAEWGYFKQVAIDEGGGIFWPNGYDFCPEFLHDDVAEMTLA
jgi:hypothetical protein